MRRIFTIPGLSGLGFLFLGLAVPELMHDMPRWLVLWLLGLGVVLLVYAFLRFCIGEIKSLTEGISFQKFALFWVQIDDGMFQLGVTPKLFNSSNASYVIDDITLAGMDWTMLPRGGVHLRKIFGYSFHDIVYGDHYIKPHSEAYFKILLPTKFDMTMVYGYMPELIIRESWIFSIRGHKNVRLLPDHFTVYPLPISLADWEGLLTTARKIEIDDLIFKAIPPRPATTDPYTNYLIHNNDRSATIDDYYIAHTPFVKGANGVLTFIRSQTQPNLSPGWEVLGQTYYEVWSDPEKLALYNSIHPPGADGLPRPIGFLSGAESEMAGPINRELSAPTTTAAEILDMRNPAG